MKFWGFQNTLKKKNLVIFWCADRGKSGWLSGVVVWLVNPSKRPVFRLLRVVRAGLYCWVMPTLNRITDSEMRDTLVEQTQVDKKTLSEHPKYLRPRVSGQGHHPAFVTGSTEAN